MGSNKKSKKLYQELKSRSSQKKSKKKSNSEPSRKLRVLETIKITENADINKYLSKIPKTMIRPKIWELQNRKSFYEWVMNNYQKYEIGNKKLFSKTQIEEINKNKDRLVKQLLPIQRLVRDFMQTESPYRGILLYFGLGVGKTLSAIAIAEAILNKKEVLVLSKTALEDNFKENIYKGGQDYMVKQNYWVFCKCSLDKKSDEPAIKLAKQIGIDLNLIGDNGGFYLIDFSKNYSNYQSLSRNHKLNLDNQIDTLMKNRFKFLHTDNTRLFKTIKAEDFDNKVIIVDEVHNLTNQMSSGGPTGRAFYDIFMNAKNVKFIFLTGTPLINNIFESSKLFNILRGKIKVFEYKIKVLFNQEIDYKKIKSSLKQNPNLDQIIISRINKTIKLTKNVDNYINYSDGENSGVVYLNPESSSKDIKQLQSDSQFEESVSKVLKTLGYKFVLTIKEETCLPDKEDDFQQLFYNPDLNRLKKQDLIKKRIAGLTSYYDYKQPGLFPDLKLPINLVACNMSDYQLGVYERYRHEEIQKDKKQARRKKKGDDNISAAYRMASRMACSFAYPEETGNPYDIPHIDLMNEQIEQMKARGEEIPEIEIENEKKVENFIKNNLLKTIKRKKNQLMNINNGSLQKYSNKFCNMIKMLNKEPGLSLVYSQFKKLIGLNIFSLALDATGEWEQFKVKKIGGIWHLVTNNPEMKALKSESSKKSVSKSKSNKSKRSKDVFDEGKKEKKRYIFYTGSEDKNYKKNIKFIFNSEFDKVDPEWEPVITKLKEIYGKEQNLRGNIIKTLMTTQTGAEGLDLKHIRSVHVMEPYWQPVLIEQVIGRAVRTGSHLRLKPEERNVSVYIYMSTIPKNKITGLTHVDVRQDYAKYNDGLGKKGKVVTSDEALFVMAEHKKVIVNQMLKLIKESAFDCVLNYKDNKISSPGLVCLDYDTKNRDQYLFTPGIDDTMDVINVNQEYTVEQNLTKFTYKDKVYYHNTLPTTDGKYYIYDETAQSRVRLPKPVGQIIIDGTKKKYGFYKKKKK